MENFSSSSAQMTAPDGGGTSAPTSKTITVDPTEPASSADASPGDGICAAASGKCSFSAAVATANEYSIPVTIYVPNGTYSIVNGLVLGNSNLTILGESQAGVLLDGAAHVPSGVTYNMMEIPAALSSVTVKKMTFQNMTHSGLSAPGGALRVYGSGHVIDSVTFKNLVFNTGGVPQGPALQVLNATNITVSNSTFQNNTNSVYRGGAAYVTGSSNVTFDTCLFDSNSSTSLGQHLYFRSSFDNVYVKNSSFSNGIGGGSALSFDTSSLSASMETIVQNSTFENNAGVSIRFTDTQGAQILNTTISGGTGSAINYTQNNSAPQGDNLIIKNTTISQNLGAAKNISSTILDAAYAIQIKNSIVYNTGAGGSCNSGGTALFTTSYSIFGDASCPAGTANFMSTIPQLGALGNNGGPAKTMLPTNPTSPAIDAANNADCSATDQRGYARPVNKVSSLTCDIGAVELQ